MSEVLNALVDMAEQGGAAPLVLTGALPTGDAILNACEAVGLTKEAIGDLFTGKYAGVIDSEGNIYSIFGTRRRADAPYGYLTLLYSTNTGLVGVYYKVYYQTGTDFVVDDIDGTAKTIPFGA